MKRADAVALANAWRKQFCNRPRAIPGLTSYRYKGRFGWIMIGARDHDDAMAQAARSTPGPLSLDLLEVWDGTTYVKVAA